MELFFDFGRYRTKEPALSLNRHEKIYHML